jgi:hypothetical protein
MTAPVAPEYLAVESPHNADANPVHQLSGLGHPAGVPVNITPTPPTGRTTITYSDQAVGTGKVSQESAGIPGVPSESRIRGSCFSYIAWITTRVGTPSRRAASAGRRTSGSLNRRLPHPDRAQRGAVGSPSPARLGVREPHRLLPWPTPRPQACLRGPPQSSHRRTHGGSTVRGTVGTHQSDRGRTGRGVGFLDGAGVPGAA